MVEFQTMAVLSTAHLTEQTCTEYLGECQGPVFAKGEFGWFVYIGLEDDYIPSELKDILDYAAFNYEVDWVCFDRDGPIDESFQVFDW